jgi:hypothetical protein
LTWKTEEATLFCSEHKKFNLVAIGGPSYQANNQGDPGSEEVGPGLNMTSNLKRLSIIVSKPRGWQI